MLRRRSTAALVFALMLPAAPALAQSPPRQISFDPFTNAPGQHESAAEPDSFSFGNTVVAVFQLGRNPTGGASGIGFATSTDGGRTWRSGVLPALTVHGTPAGRFSAATDPAVTYDRVHAVWLVSVLGLRNVPGDQVSSLVVSRSPDGITWSPPVVTSAETGFFSHDKNWIACDNGVASPFAGRCYTTWTATTTRDAIAVSTSVDGGLTWRRPVFGNSIATSGSQPVAQPNGTLVIPYIVGNGSIEAVRSTDGGASLTREVRIAEVVSAPELDVRAAPLPSAEVDSEGRVFLAWTDCRFRTVCSDRLARGTNDIVISSSLDGVTWTPPRLVTTGSSATHFVPGLGVDPTARGRLGLAYYTQTGRAVSAFFVSSSNGGTGWSRPLALAGPFDLQDIVPTRGGRFLGDYISTSFVGGGVAVPVFAAVAAPFDGRWHQAVFAAAIPPLPAAPRVEIVGVRTSRAGRLLTVTAALRTTGQAGPLRVACRAQSGGRALRAAGSGVTRQTARCAWAVPRGARVTGSLEIRYAGGAVSRPFAARI